MLHSVSDAKKRLFQQTTHQKYVLISAEYRGGSTFAGEIFNKNPTAAYLFEILYLARHYHNLGQKYKQVAAQTLFDYFTKCEYPLFNDTISDLEKIGRHPTNTDYRICSGSSTCFRPKSDSWKKAYKQIPGNERKNVDVVYENWKNFCQQQEIIATKVIRLYDLEMVEVLKTLSSEFLDNFRIIFLVRDPRGMYNSRIKTVGGWTNTKRWRNDNIKIQCSPAMSSINYIDSERGTWLRDKILFIRYEDIAIQPEIYVKKIYDFIGCQTDQGDQNTCGYNTITNNFLKLTHTNQTLNQVENMSDKKKAHSTGHRNSNEVAYKWLKEIDFSEMKIIQDHCDPKFWSTFGYKEYLTEEELIQDQDKEDLIDEKSLLSQWRFA